MEGVRSNSFSQTTVLQKAPSNSTLLETPACAFSKKVEIKENTESYSPVGALANMCIGASNACKKTVHDRLPLKGSHEIFQQLQSIANELQEVRTCHKTALAIQKHFAEEPLSEAFVFLHGDQDKYKELINADENNNYIFIHKLFFTADTPKVRLEGNMHDFAILRINKEFYFLQSMCGMFSLKEWVSGDCKTIAQQEQGFKMAQVDYSLYRRHINQVRLSDKQVKNMKLSLEFYKEFKKAKPAFNRAVNTKRNKSVSKASFNQKFIPTLFTVLENSSDAPYFRLFSTSRTYLRIKPGYKVYIEVYKSKILSR